MKTHKYCDLRHIRNMRESLESCGVKEPTCAFGRAHREGETMITSTAKGLDSDFVQPLSFTAFTVSRSITPTLPTLGYVHFPQSPVERAR